MMEEHLLVSGERFVLPDDGSFCRIDGRAEIYIRTKSATHYRQMFLLEYPSGGYAFPAADILDELEIFVLALGKCRLSLLHMSDCLTAEEELLLRQGMNVWFARLTELPWIKFLASGSDDMVEQWLKEDFLAVESGVKSLWDTFILHQEILTLLAQGQIQTQRKDTERKVKRRRYQKERIVDSALRHLLETKQSLAADADLFSEMSSPAMFAVRKAAEFFGMPQQQIYLPPETAAKCDELSLMRRLIAKGGMQVRMVTLDRDWFSSDSGVLIGYYGKERKMAAFLPEKPGRYLIYTVDQPQGILLSPEEARKITPNAFACYAGFPAKKLDLRDLMQFMYKCCWRTDFQCIIMASFVAGLIPLLTPVITETIFSDVIPIQDRQGLATVTQVMMVAGFTMAAVGLVRSVAVLRIKSRLEISSEAALWSRLLSMPIAFFRRFQAGELAERMNGISAVTALFTGGFITGVFNTLFSFWSLLLMCYYSVRLTAVALLVWALYLLVTALIYRKTLAFQRLFIGAVNKTAGQVLQVVNGLGKFRLQGAEEQAFYLWAKPFGEQWKWNLKLRWQSNYSMVINAVQPFILTLLLYYMTMHWINADEAQAQKDVMTYAQFLGFQAAFSAFNAALTGMIPLAVQVFAMVPHIENLRPLMDTEPESAEDKPDIGELTGAVDVSHLSFSYKEGGQDVIKDVSLSVKPGETVAFVGPSGCGKSTLMRLLLGFEKQRQGGIYYDGQDMAEFSVSSLRMQIGVVLQNGQLMSGDIFTNIVGTTALTMEDAWKAARMVGLAEDIEAMPMGMYTVISEGGGNISGGQRQRILIARAIAGHPKIVIMDEATSALDNRTQSIVTASLTKLKSTQLIVAHRLTTIEKADRIFVMDGGSIVEQGTFGELMALGGLFAQLAKRQLA